MPMFIEWFRVPSFGLGLFFLVFGVIVFYCGRLLMCRFKKVGREWWVEVVYYFTALLSGFCYMAVLQIVLRYCENGGF